MSVESCAEGGRQIERGRGGMNLGNQRVEGGRNDRETRGRTNLGNLQVEGDRRERGRETN